MTDVLRLVVAVAVVGLLVRTLRPAWDHRRLAIRIWRRIRVHHVVGSLALLIGVVGVATVLFAFVPLMRFGLGSLVGVSGNAVFAPVEEISVRSGGGGLEAPGVASGSGRGLLLTAAGGFFAVLLALFPWLAYVEERAFRAGLEAATLGRQIWVALRFGLLHLVMLVPIAAALAIGVAGFFYGLIYRRAFRDARDRTEPVVVPGLEEPLPAQAAWCTEAVLASTVWHATFNSLVVVLLYLGLVMGL
ncbi:MAG: hypothetical protein GEU81_12455 [Nitriliruptorales bacterium]|nr:hypothetical protein [Nitriliruptorales bacterium]